MIEENKQHDGVTNKKERCYIVTNHYNLQTFLFTGVIHSYAQYYSDYYEDIFQQYKNWVPVYVNNIPEDAIEKARLENTIPVILSVNLDGLPAPVRMISKNTEMMGDVLYFDDGLDAQLLLISSVLSIEIIEEIIFESSSDKKKFSTEIAQNGNTPSNWAKSKLKLDKKIFKKTKKAIDVEDFWKSPVYTPVATKELEVKLTFDASGRVGLISLVYLLANFGDGYLNLFNKIIQKDYQLNGKEPIDYIIAWVYGTKTSKTPLFIKMMNALIQESYDCNGKKFDHHTLAINVIKKDLDEAVERDPKLEAFYGDFLNLRNPKGLSVPEYFEKYERPQHRAMIIFSLCDSAEDLLERQAEFYSVDEFIMAACLMGVMVSWVGMESSIKDIPEMAAYCNNMMAKIINEGKGEVSNSSVIGAPRPLLSFMSEQNLKSKKINSVAIDIALDQGWDDCVKTTISLPTGNARINGSKYTYTGYFKNLVRYEIDGEILRSNLKSAFPLSISKQSEYLDKLM